MMFCHFASTKVSSQSLAAVDTDRLGMLASTAAAPGRVLSQSYPKLVPSDARAVFHHCSAAGQ